MRYRAYHGSPGGEFDRFDPKRMGGQSGYDHAREAVCFTSSPEVASYYAEGQGFVGEFSFDLENPLEIDERDRERGFNALVQFALGEGHDGIILRGCGHTAMSPGEPSDIFFVFDPSLPRRVATLQPGAPTRRKGRGV